MNSEKTTVIFDLDGTLLNTLTDITNAVNHALAALSLPLRSEGEVRRMLGDGYAALMRSAGGGKNADEALKLFTAHYAEHLEDNTRPYDGAVAALKALSARGKKMAIVSNKGDAAVKTLCRKFFYPYITEYFGVTKSMPVKPAPDMLISALKVLGSERADTVMVGDGEADILMAKAAGISSASVTWGYRTREFLLEYGAECIIDGFDGIKRL